MPKRTKPPKRRSQARTNPRQPSLLFKTDNDCQVDGCMIDELGRVTFTLKGRPVAITATQVELSYKRTGKAPKVLIRGSVDPAFPSINPMVQLLRYDCILAVDTNTWSIGGESVSVTCASRWRLSGDARRVEFEMITCEAVEFRGLRVDPERHGWKTVCEGVIASSSALGDKRIALIVDAHLDDHDDFNERKKPILDEWMLPENFRLVFATDAVGDTPANHFIRTCDQFASGVLQFVESASPHGGFEPAPAGAAYDRLRRWYIRKEPAPS